VVEEENMQALLVLLVVQVEAVVEPIKVCWLVEQGHQGKALLVGLGLHMQQEGVAEKVV
tara:strand:+ start:255 stop:431 length:177 start_codon:yes stop_codon:yes gene_type:complete